MFEPYRVPVFQRYCCFSRFSVTNTKRILIQVKPTPVKNPRLVAFSPDALRLISIQDDAMKVCFIDLSVLEHFMRARAKFFRMKSN